MRMSFFALVEIHATEGADAAALGELMKSLGWFGTVDGGGKACRLPTGAYMREIGDPWPTASTLVDTLVEAIRASNLSPRKGASVLVIQDSDWSLRGDRAE